MLCEFYLSRMYFFVIFLVLNIGYTHIYSFFIFINYNVTKPYYWVEKPYLFKDYECNKIY